MRFTTKATIRWLPSEVMICKCMQLLPPSAIAIDDLPQAAPAVETTDEVPEPASAKKRMQMKVEENKDTPEKSFPPAKKPRGSKKKDEIAAKHVTQAAVLKVKKEGQQGLSNFFNPKSSSAAPESEKAFVPP